jgi:hypothetical protein
MDTTLTDSAAIVASFNMRLAPMRARAANRKKKRHRDSQGALVPASAFLPPEPPQNSL